MKCVVPSTSVRSKYLKSLPIGTVHRDPRNNHIYEIQERKINSTLSKVGIPYFGSNEAIMIDVPDKHLKMENPIRANINQSMKEKIAELEETINQLRSKNGPIKDETKNTHFDEIVKLMDGKEFYETDREMFVRNIWTDPNVMSEIAANQPAIQRRLLKYLRKDAEDNRVITIKH
ncbi:hypothetical protein BJ741DRAFT_564379 [Chytriomyces cf. hyalinus JEL632]|nr:hypothetical protein BJ741DRAFT_564379 [Chytriomyces cf. hyalinus JEL632]